MRQGEGTASIPFAEGDVTQLRREFKLVLPEGPAHAVRGKLLAEAGEEPPRTIITSVYFDRPGLPLTVRARSTPEDCLKLRTKEYFPDRSGHRNHVVLEAKRERNGLTRKHRVWVPRASLAEALRSGDRLPPGTIGPGSLQPVLAVTYERQVFQAEAAWRVTVDTRLTFHAITSALALGRRSLRRELLSPPLWRDDRVIIEVKHVGDGLPEWLATLRSDAVRFSKFAEGMACLDRARLDGVEGG